MMLYPVTTVPGRQGAVPLHIVVAEKALGRRLPKGAEVHHIDEDKANYRNDNLVILQSRDDHAELHRKLRVLRGGGNPWTQRWCRTCVAPRDFSEFYQDGANNSRCKDCCREYARNYQRNKKERN